MSLLGGSDASGGRGVVRSGVGVAGWQMDYDGNDLWVNA
jgi:hypothetical protein